MSVCFLGVLDQVSCHPFTEELTKTFAVVSFAFLLSIAVRGDFEKQHFLAKIPFLWFTV